MKLWFLGPNERLRRRKQGPPIMVLSFLSDEWKQQRPPRFSAAVERIRHPWLQAVLRGTRL